MPTTLETATESYLRAKGLSRTTRNEYVSTLRKWQRSGGSIPVERLQCKDVREFLDWVYDQAVKGEGENPGRTANCGRHARRTMTSTFPSHRSRFWAIRSVGLRIVTTPIAPRWRSGRS
jgi:hypothetical protein